MTRYLLHRLLHAAATMFAALALIFLALRVLPGSPLLARFGQHAVPAQIAQLMAEQGWDRPLSVQAASLARQILREGDLGESFARSGENVRRELLRRVPATVELTLAALAIALPAGIAAGVVAAVQRGRWPDYLCMAGALLGVSVPVFFLGICLIGLFPGMPTGQRLPPGSGFTATSGFVVVESLLRGRIDLCAAALRHLCLPALALSSIPMAMIARITRSSMLDVLGADYVRTARAKGAAPGRVVLRHALPNAAVPIANMAGFQVGLLLSGAVLTETVFSWPGLGRYLVEGVRQADFPVVQGGALVVAAMFVTLNLLLDLLYAWLDPRIGWE